MLANAAGRVMGQAGFFRSGRVRVQVCQNVLADFGPADKMFLQQQTLLSLVLVEAIQLIKSSIKTIN